MAIYIGIDIGTTGTKAIAADESGKIFATEYENYSLNCFGERCVEQNPQDWYNALCKTVSRCVKKVGKVKAVAISSQGGAMVCVDEKYQPIRPAFSWLDHRDDDTIDSNITKEKLYEITGVKYCGTLPYVLIRWLIKYEKDTFNKTYKYLTTIDYINYLLSGKAAIDVTNAAITQLFDLKNNDWSKEILESVGINKNQLAEIISSGEIIGTLTKKAAKDTGLSEDTLLIMGAHDQYAGALGSGTFNCGEAFVSTGTAWAMVVPTKQAVFDFNSPIFTGRHAVKNLWGLLASTETGGTCMEWYRNNISNDSYELINERAEKSGIGANGLMLYPYFNGSHFPEYNHNNKATIYGLSLSHNRFDIARAIMESNVYELKKIIKCLEKLSEPIKNLKIMGGATKSLLWRQIIADILDMPLEIFENPDITCIGAIILAAGGCKDMSINKGYEIFKKCIIINPIKDNVIKYSKLFSLYEERFESLKKAYQKGQD